MLVALPVVPHGRPVDGQRGVLDRDLGAVLGRGGAGRGLEVGEHTAPVSPGQPDQVVLGIVRERHRAAEATFLGERAIEQHAHVVVGERAEGEQQRAAEQRRDDAEVRVLRGGADERHPAVLDAGQQGVLLGLAEPVHLIDEQHRLDAALREGSPRTGDDLAHFLDARRDGRDLDEAPVRVPADQRRDRGLAGAGRTPQEQRERLVGVDDLPQRRPGGQQVLLADELVERARPHAHGERRRRVVVVREAATTGCGRGRIRQVEQPVVTHAASLVGPTDPSGRRCTRAAGRHVRSAGRTPRSCARSGRGC